MLKNGVWGKELIKSIDKAIDEVVNTTDEEFHAYYKQKDEKLFGILEGSLHLRKDLSADRYNKMIESGVEDPELIAFLTEGDKPVPEDITKLLDPPPCTCVSA
jgi:hypothetical protein